MAKITATAELAYAGAAPAFAARPEAGPSLRFTFDRLASELVVEFSRRAGGVIRGSST